MWPKSNVNPTSNVNVKLMSNTDVSWRWDLVVFRLCNQNPTLSQRQIDVKYWRQPDFHFQPKSNVCLTSCPTSTWRYIDVWCLLGDGWHLLCVNMLFCFMLNVCAMLNLFRNVQYSVVCCYAQNVCLYKRRTKAALCAFPESHMHKMWLSLHPYQKIESHYP